MSLEQCLPLKKLEKVYLPSNLQCSRTLIVLMSFCAKKNDINNLDLKKKKKKKRKKNSKIKRQNSGKIVFFFFHVF
jgi:hypothetical protein